MNEIWKDCIGFENYYEVSHLGNVRRKGKLNNLKNTINKDGYHQYCFSIKGKHYNVVGHQLVAAAFIGPCPSRLIPLHNDGIRTNNIYTNLRYGTNKENTEDAIKHGTLRMGEKHGAAILTEKEVLAIRSSKLSHSDLAILYGTNISNIWHIINRKTWKHI